MSSEESTSSPATPTTPTTTTTSVDQQTTSNENVFLVESVPRGFHSAIEILNILPEALIDEMAFKILANLNNNNHHSSINVDQLVHTLTFDLKFNLQQILFQQQLSSQKMRTPLQRQLITDEQDLLERSVSQEIQNALHCITFIYKSAMRNKVTSAAMFAKCIRRQTQMETNRIRILQQHYHRSLSLSGDDKVMSKTMFHLQRLKGMDWKLSVSMSSFCCEQLNDAKVTLVFTLDEDRAQSSSSSSSVKVTKHSVELSLEEFKQFYASFADMANLITTL